MAGGGSYTFAHNYYLDGSAAAVVYPSGRTPTGCYDGNGRVAWVSKTHGKSACEQRTAPAAITDYVEQKKKTMLRIG
jgi:hypothetical protein